MLLPWGLYGVFVGVQLCRVAWPLLLTKYGSTTITQLSVWKQRNVISRVKPASAVGTLAAEVLPPDS